MTSRGAIVGAIAASIAFVMELTLVPLFLPVVQAEFGLSVKELAWFFNAYGISVVAGVLVGGWLGDKFGTRKIFGYGVILFALGSALAASAENYQLIKVARAMQGLGGGIFSPLVPIILTRASPDRPGRILILWGSVTGYAAALAPLLYSGVMAGVGWRFAFIIFAFLSIFALVVVKKFPLPQDTTKKADIQQDQAKLIRSRDLWLMLGYVFCTYGAISFYLFRIPVRLAENDIQVISLGLILSIVWISFSIASTLLRNAVDEPHVRSMLFLAPVLIAAGFGFAFYTESLALMAGSAALVGLGLACSNAPSTLLILKFAPDGSTALSASLDIIFARVGGVATIFILAQSGFGFALLGVSVLSFIAVALAFQATHSIQHEREGASP